METRLKLHEDFVASHLRSQTSRLQSLVKDIENRDCTQTDNLDKILKQVEFNLRQLRKVITRF